MDKESTFNLRLKLVSLVFDYLIVAVSNYLVLNRRQELVSYYLRQQLPSSSLTIKTVRDSRI